MKQKEMRDRTSIPIIVPINIATETHTDKWKHKNFAKEWLKWKGTKNKFLVMIIQIELFLTELQNTEKTYRLVNKEFMAIIVSGV